MTLIKRRKTIRRNKKENERLLILAKTHGISYLKVADYKGPITLCLGNKDRRLLEKAAEITARYSDAPKDVSVKVMCMNGEREEIMIVKAIKDDELEGLRV